MTAEPAQRKEVFRFRQAYNEAVPKWSAAVGVRSAQNIWSEVQRLRSHHVAVCQPFPSCRCPTCLCLIRSLHETRQCCLRSLHFISLVSALVEGSRHTRSRNFRRDSAEDPLPGLIVCLFSFLSGESGRQVISNTAG